MSEPQPLIFQNAESAHEVAQELPGLYVVTKVTNGWQVSSVKVLPAHMPKRHADPVKPLDKLTLDRIVGDDALFFDLPLVGENRKFVTVRAGDQWIKLHFDSLTAYEYAPGDCCLRFKFTVPRRWASQRGIVKFAINCKD